jgi:CRP-like cAMP-binding protein
MKDVFGDLCSFSKDGEGVFSFLCTDDFSNLSRFFEIKNAAAGEKLWTENDACHYTAIIVSGRVEVLKGTELKGQRVVVGIYGRGAIIGELCILDNSPRAVTAIAHEDVSILLITKKNFDKLINEHPELGVQLLKGMLYAVSKRLRGCFDRLVSIF